MWIETGNIWDNWEQDQLLLATSNGVLDRNNNLVMGAGMAKQLCNHVPTIAGKPTQTIFGGAVKKHGKWVKSYYEYGTIISPTFPTVNVGLFQTKGHWKDDSDLLLIARATEMLRQWCKINPTVTVHLNMPGVGLGNLTYHDVYEIISVLSSKVSVWTLTPWFERPHYNYHKPYDDEVIDGILSVTGGEDPDRFFKGQVVEIDVLDEEEEKATQGKLL
jgi:hypothetical protein